MEQENLSGTTSLNPYSNGIRIEQFFNRMDIDNSIVLILILMEYE